MFIDCIHNLSGNGLNIIFLIVLYIKKCGDWLFPDWCSSLRGHQHPDPILPPAILCGVTLYWQVSHPHTCALSLAEADFSLLPLVNFPLARITLLHPSFKRRWKSNSLAFPGTLEGSSVSKVVHVGRDHSWVWTSSISPLLPGPEQQKGWCLHHAEKSNQENQS